MTRKYNEPGAPRGSAKKVGLPRYRPEHWPHWLETVSDRGEWADTHANWQREAEALADRLRRAGLEVIWIDLEPDEFSRWCKARGYPNDREARSRFAAERIGNIPPPAGFAPAGDRLLS